jgi:anti-sigma B factor antagonist
MRLIVETAADDVLTVLVEGGLDAEACPRFVEAVSGKIAAGFTRIVLDGRRMTYLGSQGVGALLSLHTRCRKAGGDLKLAGLRGLVAEVIRTTGLHMRFDLHDTTDAARAAFGQQQHA